MSKIVFQTYHEKKCPSMIPNIILIPIRKLLVRVNKTLFRELGHSHQQTLLGIHSRYQVELP